MIRVTVAFLLALCASLGCAPPDAPPIHMRIANLLDPSQVARVQIVIVHQPAGKICVASAKSNTCSEIASAADALKAPHTSGPVEIRKDTGSSASFDDLPLGRACIVAEAFSANQTSLAVGCADVDITQAHHLIEIELVPK